MKISPPLNGVLSLLMILFAQRTWSQDPIEKFSERVNGTVWSMAIDETAEIIYVGGEFTRVGNFGKYGAELDPINGLQDQDYPSPNGDVHVSIPDGSGGYYIGGDFTEVGGVSRNRIAQIDASGAVTSWNPSANGSVRALGLYGSTVIVGGFFSEIGGTSRQRLAQLNVSDGSATFWNPAPNDAVLAVEVFETNVYVGGLFTSIAGESRTYLAAILGDGSALEWSPTVVGGVYALDVTSSSVYAGGNISGESFLSEFDRFTGLSTSWNPAPDGSFIYDVKVDGSIIYVGGWFDNIGGQVRRGIAAINLSDGLATAWNPTPESFLGGRVYSLQIEDDLVYIAGSASFANDDTNVSGELTSGVVSLRKTDGIATNWKPDPSGGEGLTISSNGSSFYAGGSFTRIGGIERKNLAAFQISDGSATDWAPETDEIVWDIELDGQEIYLCGEFTTVENQPRNYIAAVDKDSGSPTSWDPNADFAVNDLLVSEEVVYAAGQFGSIGGENRGRLAEINKTDGTPTAWNPNITSGSAYTVAIYEDILYVGGTLRTIGGISRDRIAAVSLADGSVIDWNPGTDSEVRAINVVDGILFAGGGFTVIGGTSRNYLAAIEAFSEDQGANWSPDYVLDWQPNADGSIYDIEVDGNVVYAAGNFTTMGGLQREIAAIDFDSGSVLDWNPSLLSFPTIWDIALKDDVIYAAGTYNGSAYSAFAATETSFAITSSKCVTYPDNGTDIAYLASSNRDVTFTLGDTNDESLFSLTNENEIGFLSSPDFANPLDGDTDNEYVLELFATDVDNNTSSFLISIKVVEVDDIAPTFTSNSSVNVVENSVGVIYTATADESVTFDLGNTKDEALFDNNAGEISFKSAPDFDNPLDFDSDNIYLIDLSATDAAGNIGTLELAITVTEEAALSLEVQNESLAYPNPSRDLMKINTAETNYRLILFDLEGRKIRVFEANSSHTYPMTDVVDGTYLLIMEVGNQQKKVGYIIKQ